MTDIVDRTDTASGAVRNGGGAGGDVDLDLLPHATAAGEFDEEPAKPKLGILFWICVGWLSLNVFAVVFANVLPLQSPTYEGTGFVGPSAGHWLGTDDLGRDIFSRIIFGGQVSLVIAFGSVAIGMLIGGTLGMVAGYLRGAWETVTGAAALELLAFPPIIAVLAVGAFWIRRGDPIHHINPDSTSMVILKTTIIIGILSAPLLFRVIYASTISYSTREFVTAARGLGASSTRIIFRELLPNVLPAIISFALVGVTLVIILEGSLAFLGLSVQPPTASWGSMINEGRQFLQGARGSPSDLGLTFWPVLTVVMFLLALNFITDRLRQRFDINEGRL